MPGSARLGDPVSGTCSSHKNPISVTGTISSASSDVSADGIKVARKGDSVSLSCGHTGKIEGSSSNVKSTNALHARQGDSVVGDGCVFSGTIGTASSTVIVGPE